MFKREIIKEVLTSHPELNSKDVTYITALILSKNFSDENLARYLVHMYKLCNTGRYSLTYNLNLDTHIKARDSKTLSLLLTLPKKELLPELYDNKLLLPFEFIAIEKMYNKEYYALLNTLEMSNNSNNYFLTIYNRCYQDICTYEYLEESIIRGTCKIPQKLYIADSSSGEDKAYTFIHMEIIERLARKDYRNPKTKLRFSDRALAQLFKKYGKEVKMYIRYLGV